MKQLLGELTASFDDLPPQLQEAARWVIDHPADVALLTMREQARRAGIPPATLTRLAQRFRLKGYDEVRRLHAEAVRQRPDSYRGRAEELLQRRDSEGDEALIQDIFSSLIRHLQELSTPSAIVRFRAAAEIIAGAERVFCLGLRSAFSVAYSFHYARSLFGADSVLVDGPGGIAMDTLRTIGRKRRAAGDLGQALHAADPAGGALRRRTRCAGRCRHRQRSFAARDLVHGDDHRRHRNAVVLSHDDAGLRRDRVPDGADCRAQGSRDDQARSPQRSSSSGHSTPTS